MALTEPRRVDPPAEPAGAAGVDLRGEGVRLTLCGPSVRVYTVPDAAAFDGDHLVFGGAALDALARTPGSGWTSLVARVGDPAPCRFGDTTATAAELVARLVADELAPVASLSVVSPPHWRAYRRRALASAFSAAGLPTPRYLDDLVLDLGECPGEATGATLLVEVGTRGTHLRRVSASPLGWRVTAAGDAPFGLDAVDDAVLGFVRERLGAGRIEALDGAGRSALRRACADARGRLALVPAVDVLAPGVPPVRVVRTDLDALLGGPLDDALAGLPDALVRLDDTDRVLLAGVALPVVVQTLSARTGRPVELLDGDAVALGLAGPTRSRELPCPAPAAARRPAATGSARRQLVMAVAASVVVTASVGWATPALRDAVAALLTPTGPAAAAQAAPVQALVDVATTAPAPVPAQPTGWQMPGVPGRVTAGAEPATPVTTATTPPLAPVTRPIVPITAAAAGLGGWVAAPGSLLPSSGSTSTSPATSQPGAPAATSQPGTSPAAPGNE